MAYCKICNKPSDHIFNKNVLKKYSVDYFKCAHCDFVQTSEPIWIEEAYSSAITSLDIGLINRNVQLRGDVTRVLDACFPQASKILDYAGGYGMFVRLMRDEGFDFYRQDPYCDNLFAKHFDITDVKETKFDVVTAFEVFEHFVNPLEEIKKVLAYSNDLIFSTVLIPSTNKEIENWWYIAPETGQHIAFYSKKTMEIIAAMFGKRYYSNANNLHLFTNKELSTDQVDYAFHGVSSRKYFFGLISRPLNFYVQRKSLLESDFEYIRNLINS